MLTNDAIKEVLQALSNSGLCVCEKNLVPSHHPGRIDDDNNDYIVGRIEEWTDDKDWDH